MGKHTALLQRNPTKQIFRHPTQLNSTRSEQAKYWMYETIDEQLRNRFYQSQKEQIKEAEKKVQHNEESSFAAAFRLLDNYFKEDTKL